LCAVLNRVETVVSSFYSFYFILILFTAIKTDLKKYLLTGREMHLTSIVVVSFGHFSARKTD